MILDCDFHSGRLGDVTPGDRAVRGRQDRYQGAIRGDGFQRFLLITEIGTLFAVLLVALPIASHAQGSGDLVQRARGSTTKALISEQLKRAEKASPDEAAREVELMRILIEQRGSGDRPDPGTREDLTLRLLALQKRVPPSDPSHDVLTAVITEVVARFGDGERAKHFVYRILDTGTERQLDRALAGITFDTTAIDRDESWNKVEDLFKRGRIGIQGYYRVRNMLNPERARPILEAAVRNAKSRDELHWPGKILQGHDDPGAMRIVLSKLAELDGPRDIYKMRGEELWVDQNKLAHYVETASGEDLVLGLSFVLSQPCIPNICLRVIEARRLLEHENPRVREIIPLYLSNMAASADVDIDYAEKAIESRMKTEFDPKVQRALRIGMERIAQRRERLRLREEMERRNDRR